MPDPVFPADRPTVALPGTVWVRLFLCAGAGLGLLTVLVAALAAHLPDRKLQPGGRALLRTAVEMQGWHVAALLACGLLLLQPGGRWNRRLLRAAGACFVSGIAGFCAGLYGLAFMGAGGIGGVAPVGGSVLMAGWLLLLAGCALAGRRS